MGKDPILDTCPTAPHKGKAQKGMKNPENHVFKRFSGPINASE